MAITQTNPQTIHISGPMEPSYRYVCSEAIEPGMAVELHDDSGTLSWRIRSSATEVVTPFIALESVSSNTGIETDYALGDTVRVGAFSPGSVFYGAIPSGQNISLAEHLNADTTGRFVTAADVTATAGLAKFQSLDAPGSVTAQTRLRIIVL